MTKDRSNSIYDVLVTLGGATESMRDSFVYHHCEGSCSEWRFSGKFGFGGKYRQYYNQVDYYQEDETPDREQLLIDINAKLAELKATE